MNHETELAEALRSRADSLRAHHPLGLEDVKGRARGIRRRRVAASGLVAAAVLAVGVPAGMAADARLQRTSLPGPAQTEELPVPPSETPSPSPSPSPEPDGTATGDPAPGRPVRGLLDAEGAETSGPAGIPVLFDGAIHTPSGEAVPVPEAATAFVALGEGWLVLSSGEEDDTASYLTAAGEVVWQEPAVETLAVSADGRTAAFAQPGGGTMTVAEDGERHRLMVGLQDRVQAAALISGDGTCARPLELSGCTVYLNWSGTLGASRITQERRGTETPQRSVEEVDDVQGQVNSVSAGLLLSRTVTVDPEGGTCSQVDDLTTGERLHRTCDHLVDGLSPDGRFAIGRPAYLSGVGDGSLAILDARSGAVRAELSNDAETQAFVTSSAWDADGSVLATVVQGEQTFLVRLTPEGRLTRATVDERSEWPSPDGVGMPVRLPTQP